MIKFSKEQLKTPKMMKPVYLATVGMSPFARAFPEFDT